MNGGIQIIDLLQKYIPDLYVFEGNHPKVKQNTKQSKFSCLINLINSSSGYVQTDQINIANKKGFKYIILDCTQAVGRIDIPNQSQVDCIFFSTHKYSGLFSSGFIFMSNKFFDEIFQQNITYIIKDQYPEIDNTFLQFNHGTFDYPLFIINYMILRDTINNRPNQQQLYHTYKTIINCINENKHLTLKQPQLQKGQRNTYSSVLFSTKDNICTRSLQNYLGLVGINIGFYTACNSGKDGILRISYREGLTQEQLDYFIEHFQETVEQVYQLSKKQKQNENQTQGGNEIQNGNTLDNLQNGKKNLIQINNNKFWLHNHFVQSQDKPTPKIPTKYAICFQDFILNQKVYIGLLIPEMKVRKRISKCFYINPQLHQLDLRKQVEVIPDAYISVKYFSKQNPDGTYPLLDDIISQNYEGKYYMSGYRYKFIKQHGLDISHEYSVKNNPISEFVIKQKVPIKELLISACNSYQNNKQFISKDFITSCERYRTGKDNFKYMPQQEKEDSKQKIDKVKKDQENITQEIKDSQNQHSGGNEISPIQSYTDTINLQEVNKYLYIIQPISTVKELKKGLELTEQLIQHGASIIYIADNPDKKYIHEKLKKLEDYDKWCSFDNFQHYWYYDRDRVIYTYNFK